jgi:hypothetical protein
MAFIIDKIREKIGSEGKDNGEKGFEDMNYIIGNSSAMDVGEFPTPMDERIGYASMVGGKLMELQITNPATFELEGDKMIKTIDQLGLDVTLHPDMNAGFCTAEKSARGEEYGYDTVEQYFTNYLQELAYFKKRVYGGENEERLFNIGRMNPHISTSPMPSQNERMANDVGVDPFGYEINKYDEDSIKKRNYRGENIYKNPEFLEKLYHTLFLELSNYPFQSYQEFSSYSDKFDQKWNKARHTAAEDIFEKEAKTLEDKLGAVLTASRQDQGTGTTWLGFLEDEKMQEGINQYRIETSPKTDENGNIKTDDDGIPILGFDGISEVEKQDNFKQILDSISRMDRTRLAQLDTDLFNITNLQQEKKINIFIVNSNELQRLNQLEIREAAEKIEENIDLEELDKKIRNKLERVLEDFWGAKDDEGYLMSQEAKWAGLQSHLEVQQIRLLESAYMRGKNMDESIEDLAARVFSGADPELFDTDGRENIDDPEKMHEDLLERILSGQQFQREMWKESIIFYHIIPAWMSSSDKVENDDHEGWEAPNFIWKTIVEDKWDDHDNVKLDLENPRNGVYDEDNDDDVYHYLDLLEDNREFQRDVAAAVGACYAWGHYTQRKAQFDLKGRDFGLSDEDAEEVRNEGWTWVRWMNEFGLGVNLETMQGSPQMRFKVWRPKDIAVAAHAINLTAREQLDEISDELDGCPAKFTIDMEHVATLGAPPMHEMELFWKQEGELASTDYELDIDSDKPIAKILRQMHLMDPGVESRRGGTYHGSFERGNEQLYNQLYTFVKHGFARNEDEPATILFELAEHNDESSYMMRITMDLIQLGVKPEDLDPARVDPSKKPESEEEALIGRFYGIERENYTREWAKIEEHAFDPLKGLLEAEEFDYTYSSKAAIDNGKRPGEFQGEEYK